MEILHGVKRNKRSIHDAKRERKSGRVPGILYGKGINNLLFEIGTLELEKEISKHGEHGILNIDIDGTNHRTLIKELQKDSVSHKLIHIDLEEISENTKFVSEVPIVLNGEENIRKKGGILQKSRNSVKVQCNADKLPKCFNVDVSNLNAGDCFRVADISSIPEVNIMDDPESIIFTITGITGADIPDESDVNKVVNVDKKEAEKSNKSKETEKPSKTNEVK